MSALTKITAVEGKLLLREPAATITVLGLPLALLLVFGVMPGIREPSAQFGGHSALATFIAPMAVAVLLAIQALTVFPTGMATNREKGVLRRLATTPISAHKVLLAQLLVNLGSAFIVVGLILALGKLVLGMPMPSNVGGFLVATVLGAASLFSLGLLLAGLAGTGRTASSIGSILLFPMLALGGVWVPKEKLPEFLQVVADLLPLGAALNALRESWAGASPQPLQLISMAAFTLVCGALATRFFRWQ